MAIRTVLHVVDSASERHQISDDILQLAETEGWHLAVLVIGISPPPPVYTYGATPQDFWLADVQNVQNRTETAVGAVEKQLQNWGLSADVSAQVCDRQRIDAVVGSRAQFADLTLVPSSLDTDPALRSRIAYGGLFNSGKPILLLPSDVPSALSSQRIMLSWDSGMPATRAVGHALDLLKSAKIVQLVCIDPGTSAEADGPEPGADLATYLVRHGVNVEIFQVASGEQPIPQVLERHARDQGIDLLVMGAFGRSRLRQIVFGGTTSAIVENPVLPVLMAH